MLNRRKDTPPREGTGVREGAAVHLGALVVTQIYRRGDIS